MSEHPHDRPLAAAERPLNRRAALRGGAALGLLGGASLIASEKARAAELYVLTSPGASSDNVIQPTGDHTALVLKPPSSSQTQNLLEVQDSGGSLRTAIGPTGHVGIGMAPGENKLMVLETGTGWAANIRAAKSGLTVRHTHDLEGEAIDLVNFFHTGTGDALYINHIGGTPPGSNIVAGGNAAFNALIPYHLDHKGQGNDGTVLNEKTGMKGVQIYTQAPNENVMGLEMLHSGKSYGIYLRNQDPSFAQGHGLGLYIDNWSKASAFCVFAQPGSGNIMVLGNNQAETFRVNPDGATFIQPTANNVVPLRVRGAAGQTASLQEWQQSDGAAVLRITKSATDSGALRLKNGSYVREQSASEGGTDRLLLRGTGSDSRIDVIDRTESFFLMSTRLGDFRVFPGDSNVPVLNVLGPRTGLGVAPPAGSRLTATATNAGESVAVFKGAGSQNADLQQWQSSAGDVLSAISENGYFTTRKTTAPSNSELAAGEMAIWFDSANNFPKLMVKAKQANGSVVTGSVSLK